MLIFCDDSSSYKHYDHPLYLFFINDYDVHSNELIPLQIESDATLLSPTVELKISESDFEDIARFVQLNIGNIRKMANEEINIVEFYESIIPITQIEYE